MLRLLPKQMLLLPLLNERAPYWKKDLAELVHHTVVELKPSGPFQGVHTVIIRKVDGNCLAACVAVTRIVDCIIDIQVG